MYFFDEKLSFLFQVDELKITEVTKEHKGEWRCLVRQPDLGFTWTTAIHLVEGKYSKIKKKKIFKEY